MLTVAVRFRPQHLPKEQYINGEDEKKISSEEDIESTTIEVFQDPKNYIRINNQFNLYFDHILGFKSFQDDIFNKTIRDKANDFLNGKNCCILTYGAKNSGKTYTMFGKLENKNAVSHLGILPRTISYIIEKLQAFYENKSNQNVHNAMDWNLFISFGNIYNEWMTDLIDINNTKNIHLKKNKKTNEYYLKNLTQIKIKKISSFLKNLHLAYNNRKLYLSHNDNKNIIDRCHFFVIVKLNVYTIETETNIKNKISSTILNFIDCASYPQIDYKPQTEIDRIDYDNLNFSFIQLNALMTRIAKKNDLTIDMRESLLTKLLYPIRHTNSNNYDQLLLMINCTLDNRLRAETIATLRFGNLPTNDPFILTMMEKQRHKIKKLEKKNKELKLRIKQQKKEQKEENNNNNIALEKIKLYNKELMTKNNEYFEYENKFQNILAEYKSIKKELNIQKNHNFWITKDYNELKMKYDSICNNENDEISHLLAELQNLREEKRENVLEIKDEINKYNIYDDNINDNKDPQFMIRKLKMEIIKYKTDIENSHIVIKLRNKKHKLEEKVINLRTEKAKQLVMFNQERHKMKQQIHELQARISNMKCIRKWKDLIHKRRIISIEKDMQRANKKMKENYSKNSEFRDQMYLLRKIAEQKFDLAINKNKKPSIKNMNSISQMDYEQLIIETSADFEKEMVGLLPHNLKRIHEVIDQLAAKLIQLQETRNKYDILNKKYIELQYLYHGENGQTNTDSTSSSNKHIITNSSFGEINLSNIIDLNSENIIYVDTHTKQEENYLKSLTNTAQLFNDSNHSQKQSLSSSLNINKNTNTIKQIKQKQKQLRLLQESLSLTFHIDNKKNTRIKLNVSMSPKDVYHGLNQEKNKKFTLIIQHNISSDFEQIIIPYENTNMSFWELIVEYGILNLLHFNICLQNNNNEYEPKIKYKKNSKKKDDKRPSGIWNLLLK